MTSYWITFSFPSIENSNCEIYQGRQEFKLKRRIYNGITMPYFNGLRLADRITTSDCTQAITCCLVWGSLGAGVSSKPLSVSLTVGWVGGAYGYFWRTKLKSQIPGEAHAASIRISLLHIHTVSYKIQRRRAVSDSSFFFFLHVQEPNAHIH